MGPEKQQPPARLTPVRYNTPAVVSHGFRPEGVMSGTPHKVASERFVDMFQKASEKHKGGLSH